MDARLLIVIGSLALVGCSVETGELGPDADLQPTGPTRGPIISQGTGGTTATPEAGTGGAMLADGTGGAVTPYAGTGGAVGTGGSQGVGGSPGTGGVAGTGGTIYVGHDASPMTAPDGSLLRLDALPADPSCSDVPPPASSGLATCSDLALAGGCENSLWVVQQGACQATCLRCNGGCSDVVPERNRLPLSWSSGLYPPDVQIGMCYAWVRAGMCAGGADAPTRFFCRRSCGSCP